MKSFRSLSQSHPTTMAQTRLCPTLLHPACSLALQGVKQLHVYPIPTPHDQVCLQSFPDTRCQTAAKNMPNHLQFTPVLFLTISPGAKISRCHSPPNASNAPNNSNPAAGCQGYHVEHHFSRAEHLRASVVPRPLAPRGF